MENNRLFTGKGTSQTNNYQKLPVIDPAKLTSPENYLASEGLAAAVETALTLGMPLLLTGEPGCGKSQLAYRLAWEMGFPGHPTRNNDTKLRNPIRFQIKSTTESRDLFYNFDTVGRFHAAQNTQFDPDAMAPEKYITYQALGLAILRAKGQSGINQIKSDRTILSQRQLMELNSQPERSIVLLDEIDKAPRDVPNDILNEIEALEFAVPELELTDPIRLEHHENPYRPIVIITSNSERDLPDAFLRRCVYYHIEFPPFSSDKASEVSVENIIIRRLGDRYTQRSVFVREGLEIITFLRDNTTDLNKPPGIAEILNWFDYLAKLNESSRIVFDQQKGLKQLDLNLLGDSVKNTLLKTRDDQQRADELIGEFMKNL
ncbi:MAG: MoxR family ATPase [Candidatus Thiodiazotropha sp.]